MYFFQFKCSSCSFTQNVMLNFGCIFLKCILHKVLQICFKIVNSIHLDSCQITKKYICYRFYSRLFFFSWSANSAHLKMIPTKTSCLHDHISDSGSICCVHRILIITKIHFIQNIPSAIIHQFIGLHCTWSNNQFSYNDHLG